MKISPLLVVAASLRAAPSGAQRHRRELRARPSWLRGRGKCANKMKKADCKAAKKGYCYIYAEDCARTCGCDYDQAAAREKKGLDDAHYESPDFQCVNGDEFEDKYKFNCTLYEGARWCEVGADGEWAEGPGWCSWFDPVDCDIAKTDRWPRTESYANKEGQWGKSCCCDTGLAETYPYEAGGECADRPNKEGGEWKDTNGYSCRAYHFGSFCTLQGGTGDGWDEGEWGKIKTYVVDGMSPLEACCTCGGSDFMGEPGAPTVPTYVPTYMPTYKPTYKTMEGWEPLKKETS